MPRSMSYKLTTPQILDKSKTVTRRLGWANLKPGELYWAVEKCMGLKKGEKVNKLALLRCVRNDAVVLNGPTLTIADVASEGFPDLSPIEFVAMFCKAMKCQADDVVQRIEFEYVPCYTVRTYDWELGDYTPDSRLAAGPFTQFGLRVALRILKQAAYPIGRREAFDILVERWKPEMEMAVANG